MTTIDDGGASLLLALVVAGLAGCAGPAYRSLDEVRDRLSPEAVLLEVPMHEQEGAHECGLACLEALLAYHGRAVDAAAARRFPADLAAEGGIRAGDLRAYLRERGFRAHLIRGCLVESCQRSLPRLLRTGLPVLVELDLSSAGVHSRHYVLVSGYDPTREQVVVMDPAWGVGVLPYDRFMALWAPADHLVLVAAPTDAIRPRDPPPAADSGPRP